MLDEGVASAKLRISGLGYFHAYINGEKVGDVWQVYTRAVDLKSGERLVAVADRIGYKPSSQVHFKR